MNKKIYLIILILFLVFSASKANAHQPRYVKSPENEVKNPEVSQAFYGILSGKEHYYNFYSDKPLELYVGLLIPENLKIPKSLVPENFSAEIFRDGQKIFTLDGKNYTWERYHEEFANDYYYQGPEIKEMTEAGSYQIKVFNDNNQGNYVFVIGAKEEFPLPEIINTIKFLPEIKEDFFGKPAYTAFFNKIGFFIFGPVIIFLVIVLVVIFYLKKKLRKNKKVVIGGTFDILHKGHETLLGKAFGLGEVFIGLTSNEMALQTKKRRVLDFELRKKELENYISKNFKNNYIIGKIEDVFGPTLKEDFDYIVVSPETHKTAIFINEERKKINKKTIEIIRIDYVLAEDKKPISSTRILNREIDKKGNILS
jgi:cytidyltransferase-like protein